MTLPVESVRQDLAITFAQQAFRQSRTLCRPHSKRPRTLFLLPELQAGQILACILFFRPFFPQQLECIRSIQEIGKQGGNMLASSRLSGFFRTTDPKKARDFYERVLGLTLERENEYVMIFRGEQCVIVGQKVDEFTPVPSTILGWEVQDIRKIVSFLAERGVVFERYEWMEQDHLGIWTSPDGGKVAWFKDPDGNVLSVGE
jgi:catechol 2,3-dioxygenase-like lactoylglutathione lyase family enzyme